MSIDVKSLLTQADCDKASAKANARKDELIYENTVHEKGLKDDTALHDNRSAELIETDALIAGAQAALKVLPEGKKKQETQSKLRRLNDKRDNLIDNLSQEGAADLLDAILEKRLFTVQIAEIDDYLKAIADHKATL